MNKDNDTIEEAMQEVENAFKELAFPDPSGIDECAKGLTKLEYFAAKAMQGILSNSELAGVELLNETLAIESFDLAESMIKESIKRQSK